MKLWIYFCFLIQIISVLTANGQFVDDFSDGDFQNNPAWQGDTDKFIVNSEESLQLYDETAGGTAYLSTESQAINNAIWEFTCRFDFNPSSANYADIYLCANTSDLSGDVDAYFVRIGNTADEVSLYKQSGNTKTKIIDGIDGRLNYEPVTLRVKVTRDEIGNWSLLSDTLGGTNYIAEGNVFDDAFIRSFYFGIKATFSATRWDKMFFDDFTVTGEAFIDDIAPEFLSYQIINDTALQMNFSEPMDAETCLDPINYQINGGLGNPETVSFVPGNSDKIILSFEQPLIENQEYTMVFQDLEDLAGNKIETGSFSFAIISIEAEDIIINELMPDPNPVVALPDNEYIEIYNRRNLPINLSGWKLVIGSSEYTFPSITIPANEYLIICDEDMFDVFENYGNAVGLDFAAYFLSNSGTSVQLFDNETNLITSLTYTDEWYQDSDKDDGGWSLERIDPNNTCSGMSNWKASQDLNGGTPGIQNSVFGENLDTVAPQILSWELASANEIILNFSEVPDTVTLFDYSNYYLTPDFGEPIYIFLDETDMRAVRLQFVAAFEEDVLYSLSVQNISDMCGNIMPNTEIEFINSIAKSFDLIINEIMADPNPQVFLPNAEYIELFNQSEYPLNIGGWKFIKGTTKIELPAAEVPAGEYLCLVNADDFALFSEFENIVGVNDFPSLTNASGELKLVSPQNRLIHFVNYSENWYGNPAKMEGGWSLEMIDPSNPCGTSNNWQASISDLGGTPGYENSIKASRPDNSFPQILKAIIHSPDTLVVYFDELLHPDFSPDNTKFEVNQTIGKPYESILDTTDFYSITLIFDNNFQAHIIYELIISDTITDCAGNYTTELQTYLFAMADSVETKDLIINEILFNPYTGSSDFIEIYNCSDKFINLSDVRIATRNDSLQVDDLKLITETGFMIFPNEFVVLTEDIEAVYRDYYCRNPKGILQVKELPSYNNTEGDVVICTRNLTVIDEVYYHEDWHFELLKDVKGVSLERINYEKASADRNNWHSASSTVGYATPTYENSQYKDISIAESQFKLIPESISPDNDGFEDFLLIKYQMNQPGFMMSINIYNASGHFIRQISDNELLGVEGEFLWDGLDENGEHPGSGIYIVLFDYFDLSGKRYQEKQTCVVAVKQ
jgi:hypothetical protein